MGASDHITCPTCGGEGKISHPELKIDAMSNVVMCRAGSARLSAGEAVFLTALIKEYPNPVLYDRAYSLRWSKEPRNVRNALGVFANVLAKKLRPLGYSVKANQSIGYRLVRYID
jgi:DNA-binding response OmpR family regulator